MSTKASELFPDLHSKMSKKIAQLTKVIYHLNTKNEDHQSEVDTINSNHQIEIQQILRDAASRIAKFKEIVDTKQMIVNQEALMDKMMKKHEVEKTNAIADLEKYKSKMNEREQKISKEYQNKFDGMRDEITKMNSKFQEKISTFEAINGDLKKSIEDQKSTGSQINDEVRKKYEVEIAELVRFHNEKYQTMLVGQLQIQEDMKKEMEKKIQIACEETRRNMTAEMEKSIGQIRAQLGAEKQEELLKQKRDLEEKMQKQRDELVGKLEKTLSELQVRSAEVDTLQAENRKLREEFQRKMADAEAQLLSKVGGHEQANQKLAADLSTAKEAISALDAKVGRLESQVQEREEDISRKEKLLSEKNAAISKLEQSYESSKTEIASLKAEISKLHSNTSAAESDLRTQLQTAEKEATSLRNEINSMGATVASLRDEVKKMKESAVKAKEESDKIISTLNADKSLLQKQLHDALNDTTKTNEKQSIEIDALKRKISEKEEEMKKRITELEDMNMRSLKSMEGKHKMEQEIASNAYKVLQDTNALDMQQLHDELSLSKQSHVSKMASLEEEHRRTIVELSGRHEDEVSALKSEMDKLQNTINQLSENAEGERGQLKNEVVRLEGKASALQKELESKKKEYERAESVVNGLKNQVESLRDELKATQKAFRDKMDASTSKLEADWQAKLDAQVASTDAAVRAAVESLENAHKGIVDEMVARYEGEISTLKSTLSQEAKSATSQLIQLEQERIRLDIELKKEKEEHIKDINDLKEVFKIERRSLEDDKSVELEALRKSMRDASDERERLLKAAHEAEVLQFRAMLDHGKAELRASIEETILKCNQKAEDDLKASLAALEARLFDEKTSAIAEINKANAHSQSKVTEAYEQKVTVLGEEIATLNNNLSSSNIEISDLSRYLNEERVCRQEREEAFVLEKDQMVREFQSDIRKERELAERKLLEQMDRSTADVKILKSEFADDRIRFDERLKDAQREFAALEARYRNRESRPEDLKRIEQLEAEMAAKDEVIQKMKEDVAYYKRELVNREENYNSKFAAKPNVGVMQVIKTKEDASKSGKSNKPSYAVPQSNQMGGLSAMGGIGGVGASGKR